MRRQKILEERSKFEQNAGFDGVRDRFRWKDDPQADATTCIPERNRWFVPEESEEPEER